MHLLFDIILNVGFYLPFMKVDEEDIGRNMNQLKKYDWFRNILQNPEKRELIIYNVKVRQAIGKLNTAKIGRARYNDKCRNRVNRVLLIAS